MVFDPADRRSNHRSPEIVLAEARRMAADILRRAERDAHDIRREAAEWASSARRDADAYRERVLGGVDRALEVRTEPVLPPAPEAVEPTPPPTRNGVIDLRQRAEAREEQAAARVEFAQSAERGADQGPDLDQRRAAGGSYVVGHAPPAVETSIDSKLNDVVRLAVRRTFHSRYP